MTFASLYPALIFHSTGTRVKGNMITINSSGDKESPWKIPLLMSTCPRAVPPYVDAVSQFTMLLLIIEISILGSLNHLQAFQDP